MKIIEPGHYYILDNFESTEGVVQSLRFVQKVPVRTDGTVLKIKSTGTTNKDVITVMIDRMEYLQEKMPCEENLGVIDHLKSVMALLDQRTRDRKLRGVEGTNEK